MEEIAALHSEFVERRRLSLHLGILAEEVTVCFSRPAFECHWCCSQSSVSRLLCLSLLVGIQPRDA